MTELKKGQKVTDEQIAELFTPHLQAGEKLKTTAYGIKQPNMLLMLPLFALAVLPGAIATWILTKHYFLGLTNKRLIILRTGGYADVVVKEISEYSLAELSTNPAKTKTGAIFTHMKIADPDKPFKAKFHRAFSKTNRPNAIAIAEAISG